MITLTTDSIVEHILEVHHGEMMAEYGALLKSYKALKVKVPTDEELSENYARIISVPKSLAPDDNEVDCSICRDRAEDLALEAYMERKREERDGR